MAHLVDTQGCRHGHSLVDIVGLDKRRKRVVIIIVIRTDQQVDI